MLAYDRVVFTHDHLLGHGAGVLLGDVEEAGVRRRVQADLDGGGLGHGQKSCGRRGRNGERRNIRIRLRKSTGALSYFGGRLSANLAAKFIQSSRPSSMAA